MTPAQSLRLRGWTASLAQRGVSFSCAGGSFTGLLQPFNAELEPFELGPEQRMDGVIHLLREKFNGLGLGEQSVVEGADKKWFVKRIEDNPASITVLLHCVLDDDATAAAE